MSNGITFTTEAERQRAREAVAATLEEASKYIEQCYPMEIFDRLYPVVEAPVPRWCGFTERRSSVGSNDTCPHCGVSLRGEPIPEEYLRAGYYGPWDGVTPRFYRRVVGVEVMGLYDGVAYWRCPDCKGEWPRKGMHWAWDATHNIGPRPKSDLTVDQWKESPDAK